MTTFAFGMITSPFQWAVVVAIAVLILAPGLIPPVARLAGRITAMTLRGRTQPRTRTMPSEPAAVGMETAMKALPERPARQTSGWLVGLLVACAAAVLSWWLFRSR